MGCSASVEAKSTDDMSEAIVFQSDIALRKKFVPTVITKDNNDLQQLLKILDQIHLHIGIDKQKNDKETIGVSKTKGKNSARSSKFNQILESRRMQQEEAMGRSPRSNSLASVRASGSPLYTPNRSRSIAVEATTTPTATATPRSPATSRDFSTLGPAHSDKSLSSLPYNGQLTLLKIIRNPIGLVHYWNFLHHLDYYSAVTLSPNVEEEMRTKATNEISAFLALKMVPNVGIGHTPAISTDSPYESLLLLFLQLDQLLRLGTVPPQAKNPFNALIHFHLQTKQQDCGQEEKESYGGTNTTGNDGDAGAGGSRGLYVHVGSMSSKSNSIMPILEEVSPSSQNMNTTTTTTTTNTATTTTTTTVNRVPGTVYTRDPFTEPVRVREDLYDTAAAVTGGSSLSSDMLKNTMQESEEVIRKRNTSIQQILQAQYLTQASIIHSHRVYYENLLAMVTNLQDTFVSLPSAHSVVPRQFLQDGVYHPMSLQRAIRHIIPEEVFALFSMSITQYLKALRKVVASVVNVDEEHQKNVLYIEKYQQQQVQLRQTGSTNTPSSSSSSSSSFSLLANYTFTSTFNEFYTDLDLYKLYIHTSVSPSASTIDDVVGTYKYPCMNAGIGITSFNPKELPPNFLTHTYTTNLLDHPIKDISTYPPSSPSYQYAGMCVPPRTIYIPDITLRYVREQVLNVLTAYTLTPFFLSVMYPSMKHHLTNTTAVGATAMDSLRKISSATGFTSTSSSFPSLSLQLSANPVLTSIPPQAMLIEAYKTAILAAWCGFGVPGNPDLGTGPLPLIMRPGNPVVDNLKCKPETIHPVHGTSVIYGDQTNKKKSHVPGIVTKQAISDITFHSVLGAADLSQSVISRDICKILATSSNLIPSNIGVCIISLLTPSSTHRMYLHSKQVYPSTDTLSVGMNTLKVVYSNYEFAKMCGSIPEEAMLAASSPTHSTAGSIASPRPGTRLGSAGPIASLSTIRHASADILHSASRASADILHSASTPSMASSSISSTTGTAAGGITSTTTAMSNSNSIGYLSIIGRDCKNLFVSDTDKTRILNDMMELKPIHTFAKLASPDGKRCTDVVLAMKPVFIRVRDTHTSTSSSYTGTGLGTHSPAHSPTHMNMSAIQSQSQQYCAQEYELSECDVDSLDGNAKSYASTYLAPMFYVCTAYHVKPNTLVTSHPNTHTRELHSVRSIPRDTLNIASEYTRFTPLPPLFGSDKKSAKRSSANEENYIMEYNLYSQDAKNDLTTPRSVYHPDPLAGYTEKEKSTILKCRWAHDTAWLSLFPNMQDVTVFQG